MLFFSISFSFLVVISNFSVSTMGPSSRNEQLEAEYAAEVSYIQSCLNSRGIIETAFSSIGREALDDLCAMAAALNVDSPTESNLIAAIADLESRVAELEKRDQTCDIELAEIRRLQDQAGLVEGMSGSKDSPVDLLGREDEGMAKESPAISTTTSTKELAAMILKLKSKNRKYQEVAEEHSQSLASGGFRTDLEHSAIVAAGVRVRELQASVAALQTEVDSYGGLPPDPKRAARTLLEVQEALDLRTEEFDALVEQQLHPQSGRDMYDELDVVNIR